MKYLKLLILALRRRNKLVNNLIYFPSTFSFIFLFLLVSTIIETNSYQKIVRYDFLSFHLCKDENQNGINDQT